MRMERLHWFGRFALFTGAAFLSAGCASDDTGRTTGSGGDGGVTRDGSPGSDSNTSGGTQFQWVGKQQIDINNAGRHMVAASSGNKIGIAYFTDVGDTTVDCPPRPARPNTGGPTDRPTQKIFYIESDGGVNWSTPVEVDVTVGVTFGMSIVFDGAGAPHIGYLGGNLNRSECSSSDAVIATSQNRTTWSKLTVRDASFSGGSGDTVGHWMAVARDQSGGIQSAHRDVRAGFFEFDGNDRASWLFGGNEAIVENNGGGVYTSLLYDTNNNPVVIALNRVRTGPEQGMKVALKTSGQWEVKRIIPGNYRERPGVATDGKGTFGIALSSPTEKSLRFIETKDPSVWPNKGDLVDFSTTNHGAFSSLAYDSKGNPGIAYYRCSSGENNCEANKDALMFAYRENGVWKTHEVDTGGGQFCGRQAALAFNAADEPVIGYQCVVIDNVNGNAFVDSVKVVRGVRQ